MKEKSSSIAASILSLACTLVGLSIYTTLSEWWHFIVAACSIIALYFLLYLLVELINKTHFKYFVRADVSSDDEKDLEMLNQRNIQLLLYDSLYEQSNDPESKGAIRENICLLCTQQEAKIKWLKTKSTNNVMKNPMKLPHKDFLEPYSFYCERIKDKYKC